MESNDKNRPEGTLVLDVFRFLGFRDEPGRVYLYAAASWDGNWMYAELHRHFDLMVAEGFLERLLAEPPVAVRRIYVDSSPVFIALGRVARGMEIDCQPIKYNPHLKGRVERLIRLMLLGCLPASVCGIWTDGNEIKPLSGSEQHVNGGSRPIGSHSEFQPGTGAPSRQIANAQCVSTAEVEGAVDNVHA